MRQAIVFFTTAPVILSFAGSCEDFGTAMNCTEISGTYAYRQYDTGTVLTCSGTLILKRAGIQLSGQLNIAGSGRADSIGGSIVQPDTIELYSNPHRVVLNLVLWRGVKNACDIRGEIYTARYNPPTMPLKNGTFLAMKVND